MKKGNNPIALVDFAFKKQAPLDAGTNAVINAVITWFMLRGVTSIPVISPPGSEFAKSLLGTLFPPAVVIAFAISILTSKTAVRKRIKGDVLPPLQAGTSWVKNALKWGLIRAVVNILVVYGIGGIIVQFAPDLQVSRSAAALIVGIIAALLAYLESATAVLRTPNARSSAVLPFTAK